ncbi:SHOCT domain-containing protein [Agromyces sp. SYSU T00266]|uniref:SHOCT domain-containing protein n=1 Tax=Agromyces zhanjiangensis TaxID=3158562 RepID=UPI003390EA32
MLTSLAAASAVAHAGPWGPGFGWAFLFVPILWILVIGLVVFLVTRRRRAWGGADGPPWARSASAESTLAERFAQGDIDETEYRARLEVLRTNRPNG